MKKILYRFISVNKSLRYGLLFALAFVITYVFYLANEPEFLPYFYEIGKITYTLSLSYISAFIFFFINQHLSQFNSKVKGRTYTHNKIQKIIRLNTELQQALIRYGDIETNGNLGKKTLTKDLVNKCCSKINPYQPVEVNGTQTFILSNWFEYFNYQHTEINEVISSLSKQSLFNDDELTEIIIKIEEHFDIYLNRFKGQQVSFEKTDLSYFDDGIIGFNNLTVKLKDYSNKLNKYTA